MRPIFTRLQQQRKPVPAGLLRAISQNPPRKVWVFNYGSNHQAQLAERVGDPSEVHAAHVDGYQRVFRGHSRGWGCGVASLQKKAGARTYGYVARVTPDQLDLMDRYEGVNLSPPKYKRIKVKASIYDGEAVTAVAYVSTSRKKTIPNQEYLEACSLTVGGFWGDVSPSDFPLRNPPKIRRHPITTEVIHDNTRLVGGKDLVVYARSGKVKAGHLQIFRTKPGDLIKACQDDLRVIQGDRPGIAVYIVWKSHVSEHRRNRGVGNKLYEGALNYLREKHAPGAVALVPMYCLSYGGTSQDARRVWASLARRRPDATPLAVLANPSDRDLRSLERAAASGDQEAAAYLHHVRIRTEGEVPRSHRICMAVKGVWTPWASILCLRCDPQGHPQEFAAGPGEHANARCDRCGTPVWLYRDDVALLQQLRHQLRGVYGIDDLNLWQTGGMCAALGVTVHVEGVDAEYMVSTEGLDPDGTAVWYIGVWDPDGEGIEVLPYVTFTGTVSGMAGVVAQHYRGVLAR